MPGTSAHASWRDVESFSELYRDVQHLHATNPALFILSDTPILFDERRSFSPAIPDELILARDTRGSRYSFEQDIESMRDWLLLGKLDRSNIPDLERWAKRMRFRLQGLFDQFDIRG